MINKEEIIRIKKEINEELKSKELTGIIIGLICFFILSGIFGYIGYSFCADNNYDVKKGLVFGILFPIGLSILKVLDIGNIFTYIVYTIIYIIVIDYIPTFVGIIALFICILAFIASFVFVLKKDRTDEVNGIYKRKFSKPVQKIKNASSKQYIPKELDYIESKYEYDDKYEYEKEYEDDDKYEYEKEYEDKYECERCFEVISEEEYELHDGLCEECFIEVHTDHKGHFHSDKYFD